MGKSLFRECNHAFFQWKEAGWSQNAGETPGISECKKCKLHVITSDAVNIHNHQVTKKIALGSLAISVGAMIISFIALFIP